MKKLIQHFIHTKRNYGLRALIHEFIFLSLNRFIRFEILKGMILELVKVPDSRFFDTRGLTARFVSMDEMKELSKSKEYELHPEFMRQAEQNGDRCYGIFDGPKLISYGWYSEKPTDINPDIILHFDPAWAYMYNGYTLPAYRGRGVYAMGICRALRILTEEGKKGLISFVDSKNFPALRSTAQMGYRIVGSSYMLRFAGIRKAILTAGCAAYGLRMGTIPRSQIGDRDEEQREDQGLISSTSPHPQQSLRPGL